MAYGRYLSGNPVLQSQRFLAQTLGQGISDTAQRPLDLAKMGLLESQMDADIAHRQRGDERSDRRLELAEVSDARASTQLAHNIGMDDDREERAAKQAAQADWLFRQQKAGVNLKSLQDKQGLKRLQSQINLQNEPISPKGMALFFLGSDPSRESTADFLSGDKMGEILEATGGKMIQDGSGFQKANGEVARWGDMPNISALAKPILISGRDPVLQAKQRIREYEKLGTNKLPPEELEMYNNLKKGVKSPEWKIAAYEKIQQHDIAKGEEFARRGLPVGVFERNIARRGKKIAEQKGIISAAVVQANKEKIENIKIEGKNDTGKKKSALQKDAMRQIAIKLGYDNELDWGRDKEDEYEELLGRVARLEKTNRYKNDPIGLANAAFGNSDPVGLSNTSIKELLYQP